MLIETCTGAMVEDWLELRQALWPEADEQQLRLETSALVGRPDRAIALLVREHALAVGFAEATLRHDYVNGCATSPVGFLEGIYVRPAWRRRGVARRLCDAIAAWAAGLGCSELASDTEIDNRASQAMHRALGFEQMERVVCFRRRLPRDDR